MAEITGLPPVAIIIFCPLIFFAKAVLDIVTYAILFFPFVICLFLMGMEVAAQSWAIKEVSSSLFQAPVYLTKTVIPVAFFLLMLQGLSEVLKRIVFLRNGEKI
ncbi:TRAP transporter small permease subunit [Oceanobacillus senegalensis]|uniref:TRAP transporter small permease subunit n=1 Tax=Oceanobacillus senegalensis TaxID=1936063 RepID=UPI001C4F8C63|nr:hypothetical protein [Oceanobacillus senegalensis]